MKSTEVPNPPRSSACDCTCVLTRNRSLSHDSPMLAMRILFFSCPCKVCSRVSDALSQALSLAFLADFTLSDSTAPICFTVIKLFSLANYTLLFIWIERQDHSIHMSSVLQVQQLYTAGIPLLDAYLLQIWPVIKLAKNVSPKNKMAASHVVQIHTHAHFLWSKKWPPYHVAVPTGTLYFCNKVKIA